MKFRIWICLLVLGMFCASVGIAMEQPTPPEIVKMKTKQGDVLFHHAEHQAAVKNCQECHHTGFKVVRCRDCHGIDHEVPRLKHAFHRQCRNCHIKNGGPTECDTCHQK